MELSKNEITRNIVAIGTGFVGIAQIRILLKKLTRIDVYTEEMARTAELYWNDMDPENYPYRNEENKDKIWECFKAIERRNA